MSEIMDLILNAFDSKQRQIRNSLITGDYKHALFLVEELKEYIKKLEKVY